MNPVVLQRAYHFKARAVAHMREARVPVAAEVALQNPSVGRAIEERPHASSSRTHSGASLACNSAIRQLFRYCPPRMVSAKWTRQPSRSSTLASAAAIRLRP